MGFSHMDPYNQYNYRQPPPGGMEQIQYGPDGQPLDGDRGLGKKIAIGVGVAALAVGAAVVAGGVYHYSKKQKKKKKVKVNGKTREIDCDVLVDDRGIELPGQEFDESGRCINEQEVVSRAVNNGQVSVQNQQQGGYGAPMGQPNYNSGGYGAPMGGYGAPPMGQPNYGAPMGGYGAPMGQPNYGQPNYNSGGYGAPPSNFGMPPSNMGPGGYY